MKYAKIQVNKTLYKTNFYSNIITQHLAGVQLKNGLKSLFIPIIIYLNVFLISKNRSSPRFSEFFSKFLWICSFNKRTKIRNSWKPSHENFPLKRIENGGWNSRERKGNEKPNETKAENLFFLLVPPTTTYRGKRFTIPRIFRRRGVPHKFPTQVYPIPASIWRERVGYDGLRWVERFVPAEWSGVIAVSHGRRLTRVQQMCSCPCTEQTGDSWVFGRWDTSLEIFSKDFQGFRFSLRFLKLLSFVSNQTYGILVEIVPVNM